MRLLPASYLAVAMTLTTNPHTFIKDTLKRRHNEQSEVIFNFYQM